MKKNKIAEIGSVINKLNITAYVISSCHLTQDLQYKYLEFDLTVSVTTFPYAKHRSIFIKVNSKNYSIIFYCSNALSLTKVHQTRTI